MGAWLGRVCGSHMGRCGFRKRTAQRLRIRLPRELGASRVPHRSTCGHPRNVSAGTPLYSPQFTERQIPNPPAMPPAGWGLIRSLLSLSPLLLLVPWLGVRLHYPNGKTRIVFDHCTYCLLISFSLLL
jgi:hypothetical protein